MPRVIRVSRSFAGRQTPAELAREASRQGACGIVLVLGDEALEDFRCTHGREELSDATLESCGSERSMLRQGAQVSDSAVFAEARLGGSDDATFQLGGDRDALQAAESTGLLLHALPDSGALRAGVRVTEHRRIEQRR